VVNGGRQSSSNDPVTISPAGSYVPITTPVVETLLSISFSPAGTVPSETGVCPIRRRPGPLWRAAATTADIAVFVFLVAARAGDGDLVHRQAHRLRLTQQQLPAHPVHGDPIRPDIRADQSDDVDLGLFA
jgi:hypothetical protein